MIPRALAAAVLFSALVRPQQPPNPSPPPPVQTEEASQQPVAEREVAALVNTGLPMRVAYDCTEEDIRVSGISCTIEDPCPIYLELSAVEPVGIKLFISGNIHTSSATLYSVLLASEDGGKTWIERFERIRFGVLDQIQFLDFETGWVGGQVVHPLGRDPFLLLTTDGGRNWKQRQVFEESRIGVIERFWFDSRTTGSLWLDRRHSGEPEAQYERYETATGGESWMLREVSSRPIPVKVSRAALSAPDWRLLADEKSTAYLLEKRHGETWQTVASFLIPIGQCRPEEKPLTERQPEPAQPPAEQTTPPPARPSPPLKPKPA